MISIKSLFVPVQGGDSTLNVKLNENCSCVPFFTSFQLTLDYLTYTIQNKLLGEGVSLSDFRIDEVKDPVSLVEMHMVEGFDVLLDPKIINSELYWSKPLIRDDQLFKQEK